jgi:hypothetical protein
LDDDTLPGLTVDNDGTNGSKEMCIQRGEVFFSFNIDQARFFFIHCLFKCRKK